ncbi:MAG TPA: rhomboid family intramembrane serine protease [Myxococcota bacterium]
MFFLPVRDENPTLDASVATLALIGTNLLCWALVQGFGTEPRLSMSVCSLGAIPGELLGTVAPGTAVALGGGFACVTEADPDWATAITSMFMHGSWLHLLGNLWFLWLFGDNVEDALGHVRFAVFYLLCGLAAFAAQALSDSTSAIPMVGASGAIGGVLGAYARLYPHARVHVVGLFFIFLRRFVVPAVVVLGMWFLIQILSGLPALGSPAAGGVAFWAHVGGFLAGLLLVGPFSDPRRLELHRVHRLGRHMRSERDGLGD